jgi:uncharacterized protein DUF1360
MPDPQPVQGGYAPGEDLPLGGYALLTTVFHGGVAAYALQQRRAGRSWPGRIGAGDLALLGAATYKLSRIITKDRVTSFLRSPFTRYSGEAGPAEVSEEPRGRGLRRAVGELLVCPYCMGQWVATALVAGYAREPEATRTVAGMFAVVAAADFLQQAWAAIEKRA